MGLWLLCKNAADSPPNFTDFGIVSNSSGVTCSIRMASTERCEPFLVDEDDAEEEEEELSFVEEDDFFLDERSVRVGEGSTDFTDKIPVELLAFIFLLANG